MGVREREGVEKRERVYVCVYASVCGFPRKWMSRIRRAVHQSISLPSRSRRVGVLAKGDSPGLWLGVGVRIRFVRDFDLAIFR